MNLRTRVKLHESVTTAVQIQNGVEKDVKDSAFFELQGLLEAQNMLKSGDISKPGTV